MSPTLRPATDLDFEFAFQAKKDAMGSYIAAHWGWDDDYQLAIHKQRWSEKPWFVVMVGDQRIGTVSIHELPEFVRFGEFYLLSEFRRRGLGTAILTEFLQRCDQSNRAVRLEYLKWNPVGSLYKRHGFKIVAESDSHYFLVREPSARKV